MIRYRALLLKQDPVKMKMDSRGLTCIKLIQTCLQLDILIGGYKQHMKKLGYLCVLLLIVFVMVNNDTLKHNSDDRMLMPDQTFDASQGIIVARPHMMHQDTFLYRAAMSEQFSNVYSLATRREKDSTGKYETVETIRKYTRIDDFKMCVEKSSPERMGTAEIDQFTPDRLHQPKAFAAQLLAGSCVQAPKQSTHQARYKLSRGKKNIRIEDLVSGVIHKTPIQFMNDERIWALFGLQDYKVPAYTNRNDPLNVDKLSLEDIERALNGSRETQLAVLELIGDRIQVERNAGFQVKTVEIRPTDPRVAGLLIDSGVFQSNDRRVRRFALRAAATIPSQEDKLFPEIISALTTTIVPKALSPKEKMEKARIEKSPRGYDEVLRNNRHLFESKSPTRGYFFPEIVNAAGFAAASFGREASDTFLQQIPSQLIEKFSSIIPFRGMYDRSTRTIYDSTGLYLALITSSSAENHALKLLAREPQRSPVDRAIPEVFLATMPDMPLSVESVMFDKCDDAFEGKPSLLSPLFCNSMLAKSGDQEALIAVQSAIKTGKKQTQSLAARELLLNHGTNGILILKEGLLNGDLGWNGIICQLGAKAGQDVVHYIHSLALVSPENMRLQRTNKSCQRSMPTMLGIFAS